MQWNYHIRRKRRKEGGSALVASLCLIFMAGMLTGTILMLSHIATYDVRSHVELQRSIYINEGTANRIQWLLSADRNVHPGSVFLGELDYSEFEYDRYTADGIPHSIDYHGTEVQVTLFDAVSGYNLSSNSYRNTLNRIAAMLELDDTEIREKTDLLAARIQDYMDTDDNVSTDGMETQEYEENQLQPLPRNNPMYFREELAFIPGIMDFFPPDKNGILSGIMLFTPQGMSTLGSGQNNAPSIMTATPQMLKVYANLDDSEIEQVIEARNVWFKEKTPLSEQLDTLLLSNLRSRFSFNESGYFTVHVEAPDKSNRPSRKMYFTFPVSGIGGPVDQMVRYYDWLML